MDLRNRILQLLQENSPFADEITEDSSIIALGLDSLTLFEIIVDLEDDLGVRFDEETTNIYDWEKVKDMIDALEIGINPKNKKN